MLELVKEARSESKNAWIAWKACTLFVEKERGAYITEEFEKRIAPIPEPINELMKDCFEEKIEIPKKTKSGPDSFNNELRNDAIRFAIWMSLEADIKTTSRDKNKVTAASIVAEQTGYTTAQVLEIWKTRKFKSVRKGKKSYTLN